MKKKCSSVSTQHTIAVAGEIVCFVKLLEPIGKPGEQRESRMTPFLQKYTISEDIVSRGSRMVALIGWKRKYQSKPCAALATK